MAVRMRAEKQAVGPRKEDCWEIGDEIFVSEELAQKFERSGMAVRIIDSEPQTAELGAAEAAVRPRSRNRARA